MITNEIGKGFYWARAKITDGLVWLGMTPNQLTLIGMLVTFAAGGSLALGRFKTAGYLMILAGALDFLDGTVARASGKATRFGALFDSSLDRYGDTALFLGVAIYYLRYHAQLYVALAIMGLAGSLLISYVRARAECVVPSDRAGFWERPERTVLLMLGMFFGRMPIALWILAILPHVTVIQRMMFARRQMAEAEG